MQINGADGLNVGRGVTDGFCRSGRGRLRGIGSIAGGSGVQGAGAKIESWCDQDE
jgi:hypothetical protein